MAKGNTENSMCCVCDSTEKIVENNNTHCPGNHKICKTCFLNVIKICFCEKSYGDVLYICPMCRNIHHFSNQEMYKVLLKINEDDKNDDKNSNSQIAYLGIHKTCENRVDDILIKKCLFFECGCRENIVDIKYDLFNDISTEDLIKVAKQYNPNPIKGGK